MTVEAKEMNTTKKVQTTAVREPSTSGSTGSFFADVKSEFQKITWTEPAELKTYTKVVVGATFVVGFGIYLIDLTLQTTLNTLEYLIKAIVG